MDTLSPEILIKIFNYLHLKQKHECILVCRSWAQILANDSCTSEIVTMLYLPSSTSFNERVYDLIRKAKKDSNRVGRKCKRLILENRSNEILGDVTDLAKAFPYLKFAIFKSDTPIDTPTNQNDDSFQSWRNSLETLIDLNLDDSFFTAILSTGVFHRLTTLALRFAYLDAPINFKPLKQIPLLTTLFIDTCQLSVLNLEELHDNTPNLVSFDLGGNFIFDADQIDSLHILPATQIKKFKTLSVSRVLSMEGFILYISKKYLHLNELDFSHGGQKPMIPAHGHYAEQVIRITHIFMDYLTTLGPGPIKCTMDLEYNVQRRFDRLLGHASNLESLSSSVHSYYQLTEQDLTHPLFRCLHTLSLSRIPTAAELTILEELKALKKLTLKDPQGRQETPTMINDLIEALPRNIESLSLMYITLTTTDQDIEDKLQESSSITCLNLTYVNINKRVVQFINSRFQKLKSLSLQYCLGVNEFELSNHHLSLVEITPQFLAPEDPYYDDGVEKIHLQLTRSNRTRYYKIPNFNKNRFQQMDISLLDLHDHTVQHSLEPCLLDEDVKYFRFKCSSALSLYFCGLLIL